MSNDARIPSAHATVAAEADDLSLKRWERHLVVVLSVGLAVSVAARFVASPDLASMMLEYVLKFVPPFVDRSVSSVLDFNGVGDPRGRVVNSFFAWLNIQTRKELLLTMAMHPALSVNWLLYPLTLAAFYSAIRRMSKGPRYAIMATLLYAASPGMLNTLIDYYLPGKALMNFWFAAALYGASMLVPAKREQRPALGAFLLGSTTFLGLLSDETAIFIPICIFLLFSQQIFFGAEVRRVRVQVVASFIVAFVAYGLVVLVAIPLANIALGLAQLDLVTSLLQGPYAAMFGAQPRPIGSVLQYYAPFGLLETILSAHFVPSRIVTVSWTYHKPFPWFFQWSLREQLALYSVIVAIIFLLRSGPSESKPWIRRTALALLLYVVVQALFFVALSGYVIESSYYAALASSLLALLIGAIAAAPGRSQGMRVLSWTLVVYVMAVQFANMVDTARRHPYLGTGSFTWQDVKEIHAKIAGGEVDQTLAAQAFPSRRFLYAFETAAAFESARGQRVDFRPMEEPQQGLVHHFDLNQWADPNIARLPGTAPRGETEARGATLLAKPVSPAFFHAGTIRGEIGDWGYQWRFDGTGTVIQKSWRYGLMRLWSATGRVEQHDAEVCLVFATAPRTCFASLYRDGEWVLAFAADGRLSTRFRWER